MQVNQVDAHLSIFDINEIELSKGLVRKQKIETFIGTIKKIGFIGIKVERLTDLVDRAYQAAEQYFALSLEIKQLDKIRPEEGVATSYGGFMELGTENVSALGTNEETEYRNGDYKESYLLDGHSRRHPQTVNFKSIEEFHDLMGHLANRILNIFHEFFEVENSSRVEFDKDSSCSVTRLSWYPPFKTQSDIFHILCGGHYDTSPFALMAKSTTSGFQMKLGEEYVDLNVPDNVAVFNTGRLFEAMTAGVIKPTYHRVIANQDSAIKGRFSLIHFPAWDPQYYIEPWEKCVEETTQHLSNGEEKTKVIKGMLRGTADKLFRIYCSMSGHITISDAEIRELAHEFPNHEGLKTKWPWAFHSRKGSRY